MQSNPVNEWAADPTDHRVAPRYRFYADLEIDWESKALWGRVRDISREGMFIEIADCLWVNARFSARLALDTPLPVECFVRRIAPGRGIGVTIAFPNTEAKRRFNALLRALRNEADPAAAGASIPLAPEPLCAATASNGR